VIFRLAFGIFTLSLGSFLTGCSEDKNRDPGQVVFLSQFENHAWSDYGDECRIMSSGRVERYKIDWVYDSSGSKKEYTELPPDKISRTIVEAMEKKIPAAKGDLGEFIGMGADFGMGQFIALDYSQDRKNAKEIILIEWGDGGRINPNETAVELVTWLSGVFAKAGCPEMGEFDPRKYSNEK